MTVRVFGVVRRQSDDVAYALLYQVRDTSIITMTRVRFFVVRPQRPHERLFFFVLVNNILIEFLSARGEFIRRVFGTSSNVLLL